MLALTSVTINTALRVDVDSSSTVVGAKSIQNAVAIAITRQQSERPSRLGAQYVAFAIQGPKQNDGDQNHQSDDQRRMLNG